MTRRSPSSASSWTRRPRCGADLLLLREYPLGDGERGVGGGNAGVDRRLEQHLADLVGAEAVAARRPHVEGELVEAPQRHEHGEGDARARPAVQTGPRPDVAPCVAGDEVE